MHNVPKATWEHSLFFRTLRSASHVRSERGESPEHL
jgi:hypothetical protein